MSTVWNKLFGNAALAANDEPQRLPPIEPSGGGRPAPATISLPHPANAAKPTAAPEPAEEAFDAIGRRNETLRNQLDSIAESFRNIDAIRTQFEQTVPPIARLLKDLEETRAALEETRHKHAAVAQSFEELARAHDAATSERDAFADERDALSSENRRTLATLRETEATLGDAQISANEAALKIANLERSLESANGQTKTLEEANASFRSTLDEREKTLTETEQKRTALGHQLELAQEEARALRRQIDEQTQETSRIARLQADGEAQRGELTRKVGDLETQLGQESAAHAKLRAQRQDEVEAHRAASAALSSEITATRARAEAAERLLGEARQELRERMQESRALERRLMDSEAAAQAQAKKLADVSRELAAAQTKANEAEASRAILIERSTSLAKDAKTRENALNRAEEREALMETRLSETMRAFQSQRAQLEARIVELSEQIQSDSAARAYAEGALQSARRDRLAMQRELVGLKTARGQPVETPETPAEPVPAPAVDPEPVVVRMAG